MARRRRKGGKQKTQQTTSRVEPTRTPVAAATSAATVPTVRPPVAPTKKPMKTGTIPTKAKGVNLPGDGSRTAAMRANSKVQNAFMPTGDFSGSPYQGGVGRDIAGGTKTGQETEACPAGMEPQRDAKGKMTCAPKKRQGPGGPGGPSGPTY